MSVPGPTDVRRYPNCDDRVKPTVFLNSEYHFNLGETAYTTYFDASKDGENKFGDNVIEPFSVLQRRTIEDFDRFSKYSKEYPDFGMPHCSCLSKNIVELQQETLKKYR